MCFVVLNLEAPGEWEERMLWRFAKARNWDVERAAQAIHACIAWRAEYSPAPVMEAHMPAIVPIIQRRLCYLYGYNRQREPCIIGFPARYIPKDMPTPAIVRFTVYVIENAIAAMKPPVETFWCALLVISVHSLSVSIA